MQLSTTMQAPTCPVNRFVIFISKAFLRVEKLMEYLSVGCLFTIMVLIFLDAVLRYTLNKPLIFTVDLVTLYLISGAMFLVLSSTLRVGGHICVDLFAELMPKRLNQVLLGVGYIGSVAVVGIMAWEISLLTYESWHLNEKTVGLYAFPLWLEKGIVAISLIALAIRVLIVGLINLGEGITGKSFELQGVDVEPDNSKEEAV